jgi:hypothetical protein
MDSPIYKGHNDLTYSLPSSDLLSAVNLFFFFLRKNNFLIRIIKKIQGLHSLGDLTKHIKTRIDDSHAPPGVYSLEYFNHF